MEAFRAQRGANSFDFAINFHTETKPFRGQRGGENFPSLQSGSGGTSRTLDFWRTLNCFRGQGAPRGRLIQRTVKSRSNDDCSGPAASRRPAGGRRPPLPGGHPGLRGHPVRTLRRPTLSAGLHASSGSGATAQAAVFVCGLRGGRWQGRGGARGADRGVKLPTIYGSALEMQTAFPSFALLNQLTTVLA